ncbi:MAG TPA: cytochrome c, partial [Steroidobacteraceae bacterium]|nr:cytochrome c [Steroidobacteraceae bacterium]
VKIFIHTMAVAICCSVAAAYADEGAGQQAFAARCLKCHSESGFATATLSRRVGEDKSLIEQRTDLAPEFIRHAVRNGIVSMPAITRVEVTDEELDSIVRYLTRPRASARP